jgi:hypothetical protein
MSWSYSASSTSVLGPLKGGPDTPALSLRLRAEMLLAPRARGNNPMVMGLPSSALLLMPGVAHEPCQEAMAGHERGR